MTAVQALPRARQIESDYFADYFTDDMAGIIVSWEPGKTALKV